MATKAGVGRTTRTRTRKKPTWVKRVKQFLAFLFLLGLIVFITLGVLFALELRWASEQIPRLPALMSEIGREPTVIVSEDGKPLYRVSTEFRQYVPLRDIPETVRKATLAAEDKRFYEHSGVDYWAVGRALITNVRERRGAEGASTLTMQLSKRILTGTEHSFRRKVRDAALAIMMERQLSKNQILELYLNQVFYGKGAFGIKVAADTYFGKKLDDLTIAEAATLARIVRRPSEENPFDSPERALRNRDIVLGIMRGEGMITQQEYDEAKAEELKLRKKPPTQSARIYMAPYFVNYVLDYLHQDLPGIDFHRGGYRIETTLNTDLQKVAEQKVAEVVRGHRNQGVNTAAFVLIDRQGRILCMVGGGSFDKNQFNVITQGRRQPGSSFKPFVYATALSNGALDERDYISNAAFSWTDPATGKVWRPKNSNGKFGGSVSVRSAIANSYNMPAIRTIEKATPSAVVAMGYDVFGFRSQLGPNLSLALGTSEVRPIEMAQAYSVFMLRGERATPFGITRVIAPDGTVVKDYRPNVVTTGISPYVAHVMDGFLRAVVEAGTARAAMVIPNARGKTGTTDDNKDAWFCGYTNEFLGIGWVGNERYDEQRKRWVSEKMASRVFGGTVTINIWVGVMKRAHEMATAGKLGGLYVPGEEPPLEPDDDTTVERTPVEMDPGIHPGPEPDMAPPRRPGEPELGPERGPTTDLPPGAAMGDSGPLGAAPPREPTIREPVIDPPPVAPPRREPPPRRVVPVTEETVHVEICAENHLRATMYCPETVTRTFTRKTSPKRFCTMHRP
ncbi:MAG TPA: PBP1A family penicillin-binding protein [Fimbriimonadaceae bacterium]|nr:PBP1A family penicillin-binding protein [Fimbriimonadaceae bacterium]